MSEWQPKYGVDITISVKIQILQLWELWELWELLKLCEISLIWYPCYIGGLIYITFALSEIKSIWYQHWCLISVWADPWFPDAESVMTAAMTRHIAPPELCSPNTFFLFFIFLCTFLCPSTTHTRTHKLLDTLRIFPTILLFFLTFAMLSSHQEPSVRSSLEVPARASTKIPILPHRRNYV